MSRIFMARGQGQDRPTVGGVRNTKPATDAQFAPQGVLFAVEDSQQVMYDGQGNKTWFVDTTAGNVTVVFPAASADNAIGVTFTVKRKTAGANTLTIAPESGTIEGSVTAAMPAQYDLRQYRSNGTEYLLVGGGTGGAEANTASNVGTAGVGLFKQKSGVDLQFKKVNAGAGGKVTITDDAANDEVDINVVDATTAQAGAVELATEAETVTGTDTTRAVTPAGVAAAIAAIPAAWTFVSKATDTTRNSNTTTAADPALQFSLAASANYNIRIVVKYRTTAAGDFKWGLAGPAAPTEVYGSDIRTDAVGVGSFEAYPTNVARVQNNAGAYSMVIELTVENGANAGTFSFDWAQNTSDAGPTVVKAGSYIEYRTY